MAVCYLVADAVMVVNKERGREVGLSRAFAKVTVEVFPGPCTAPLQCTPPSKTHLTTDRDYSTTTYSIRFILKE